MMTSKLPASNGRASMLASTKSECANPSRSRSPTDLAICSSVKSTPTTTPRSPTWRAAQKTALGQRVAAEVDTGLLEAMCAFERGCVGAERFLAQEVPRVR
jgi:hypothetical protein